MSAAFWYLCPSPGTPAQTEDALLDAVFVPQGKIDGILFQKNTERLKEFQQAFGLAAAADAFRLLGEETEAFKLTPATGVLQSAEGRLRAGDRSAS